MKKFCNLIGDGSVKFIFVSFAVRHDVVFPFAELVLTVKFCVVGILWH